MLVYVCAMSNFPRIMIGAPKGEFPGGLTGLTPNGLACRPNFTSDSDPFGDDDVLRALSDPDEIWPCYRGRQWGLVYQCYLHEDECVAPVGNGDPESYDGLLFDRVGMCDWQILIHVSHVYTVSLPPSSILSLFCSAFHFCR